MTMMYLNENNILNYIFNKKFQLFPLFEFFYFSIHGEINLYMKYTNKKSYLK